MNWDRIYQFPIEAHARKHGPRGYKQYRAMKHWLRDEFKFRCVYCFEREQFSSDGHARFAVDHAVPKEGRLAKMLAPSEKHELQCCYDNLVYCCNRCNAFKGTNEDVLIPMENGLGGHISCGEDGIFCATTSDGQDHIDMLQLNDPRLVEFRRSLIGICKLTCHESPNPILLDHMMRYIKFPNDLPDLQSMKPPDGNQRPDGVDNSYFALRSKGDLPDYY